MCFFRNPVENLSSFRYHFRVKQNWEITEEISNRQSKLEESGYTAYCLRTRTGWECDLARNLNYLNPSVLALPFLKVSHKSTKGVKSTELRLVLPSYVFLFSQPDLDIWSIDRKFREGFSFVTNVNPEDIVLKGGDLRYARWVFGSAGIIGMSRAIKVNGRVKIIDGPLLSLEGHIKEYSKKNRNCRIETVLFNRVIDVWLPFTYVEEIKEG